MKCLSLLPLVALSAALVIPDDDVISQIAIEPRRSSPLAGSNELPLKESVDTLIAETEEQFAEVVDTSKHAFDRAVEFAEKSFDWAQSSSHRAAADTKAWMELQADEVEEKIQQVKQMSKHGKHGKHGHHCKPNQTVYELIAKSKYTTKLAALINEYDDLVELLNGTAANYTVFAPVDRAFEKIPDKAPKPTKEELKQILLYHTSKEFYPAGRVLVSTTIPTLYIGELIGGEAQRLSTNLGFRGLTVNFYSRIIAVDIFGTNGVIHGVDSLLLPPPKAAEAIPYFPGEFSTLELGLTKTGLIEELNDTSTHTGGTVFAPSNFAFQKLGPKLNGFLFSKWGLKYLKAILAYHLVADQTLYSDAYYKSKTVDTEKIPKGFFHVDLPTALKGKSLSVDVARYGRLISIKINAFTRVTVPDGIVADGVIHVVSSVLIPPKKIGEDGEVDGSELSVDELKERLDPYVDDDDEEYAEL